MLRVLWVNPNQHNPMYQYHQIGSLIAAAIVAAESQPDSKEQLSELCSMRNELGLDQDLERAAQVESLVLVVHNTLANADHSIAHLALAVVTATTGNILAAVTGGSRATPIIPTPASHTDKRVQSRILGKRVLAQEGGMEALRLILGYFGCDSVTLVPADHLNELNNRLEDHLRQQAYRVGQLHPSAVAAADDGPSYETDETASLPAPTNQQVAANGDNQGSDPLVGEPTAEQIAEAAANQPVSKDAKPAGDYE